MKKNLNFSEWLGLVTSVSALYSYIYYYKYWRFFGINAYDYFSYIDALQHSIPSIIMVLTLSQALILSFTYHIFFDRKAIVSFYRCSYFLAKTNHYKNVLKQSIVLFVLIILFDYFFTLVFKFWNVIINCSLYCGGYSIYCAYNRRGIVIFVFLYA